MLLGWAAATGDLGPPAVLLYGAGIAWTLGYDFAWQIATVKIDDSASCLTTFKSNRVTGWILLTGILAAEGAWARP